MKHLLHLAPALGPFDPETPNGEAFWNDPHISASMLAFHLDPGHDAASRRPALIRQTLDWILGLPGLAAAARRLDILDLGCGPGLYAQALAQAGHRVCGVDISERSLAHAREAARAAGLAIDYRLLDYTRLEDEAAFDLAILIYCDFGALRSAERAGLLPRIRRALRPGGRLVLDVWDEGLPGSNPDRREWSWNQGGFWSPREHLLLEEWRHFPALGAIARRSVLVDARSLKTRVFQLRDFYYSPDKLFRELAEAGFSDPVVERNVIRQKDFVDCGILFAHARA